MAGAGYLRKQIKKAREELDELINFDEEKGIDKYFDRLQEEAEQAHQVAIERLKKDAVDLSCMIDDYRENAKETVTSSPRPSKRPRESDQDDEKPSPVDESLKQELTSLSSELGTLNEAWKDSDKEKDWKEVDRGQRKLSELREKIELLDSKIMSRVFNGKMVKLESKRSQKVGELLTINLAFGSVFKDKPMHSLAFRNNPPSGPALFLNDGNLVFSSDETIMILDLLERKILFELDAEEGPITSMILLKNGWLASGSESGAIKIWDLKEQKLIKTLKGDDGLVSLKLLRAGNLASWSGEAIQIWNPETSEETPLLTIPESDPPINVNPLIDVLSNGHIVTGSNESGFKYGVKVCSPEDGALVKPIAFVYQKPTALLVLSDDRVAIGCKDGRIEISDLNGEKPERVKLDHEGEVSCLVQFRDKYLLSAGSDPSYTICVWDLDTDELIQTISTGHKEPIVSLCLSNDAKILASVSSDQSIKIWSTV